MVGARLPLVQALETAAGQCAHERLRQTLHQVGRAVQAGHSLSDSLARHPHVFGRLYIHLTRAGEEAGVMGEVLLRLAGYLEKSAALRRKVHLALVYPAVVLVVAVAATTFLLTTIVPTFAEMFADFGSELPAPTRLVLRMSRFVTQHFGAALLGLCLGVAGFGVFRRTARGAYVLDRFVLRVPLIGPLLLKNLVARFCRTLGTLLHSGVVLVDALGILAHTAGNRVVEREVVYLLHRVRRGSSLNQPLRKAGLFPEMVVQLIAVGEQTAELDRMLFHAADYYEQEVDAYVETLTSVIEPVLIVLIGLLLGGILVALYLPMFDLITVVG